MKYIDLFGVVTFLVLQAGAIETTYVILGKGGTEVYPLMSGNIQNVWFLILTKILALVFILTPYLLVSYFKNLQIKTARYAIRGMVGFVVLIAGFDVTHNLLVLNGVI